VEANVEAMNKPSRVAKIQYRLKKASGKTRLSKKLDKLSTT
jgi:hypothetical protein